MTQFVREVVDELDFIAKQKRLYGLKQKGLLETYLNSTDFWLYESEEAKIQCGEQFAMSDYNC